MPKFAGSGATQAGTAININVNKPAAAVAETLWGVNIQLNGNRTFATPSGFAILGAQNLQFITFYKVCDGSEGSSVNFGWGVSANYRITPFVFEDVDLLNPIVVASAWATAANGTSIAAPDVTDTGPAGDNLLVSLGQLIASTNDSRIPKQRNRYICFSN